MIDLGYLLEEIDGRSFLCFRYLFSFLMLIYCMNKITDVPLIPNFNEAVYGYYHHTPLAVYNLSSSFPWYTDSYLHWNAHNPLMLMFAVCTLCTCGYVSRTSFFLFSLFKMMLTLQDQTNYNNHEYLYALLAFLFGLCNGHSYPSSFIGICTLQQSTNTNNTVYTSIIIAIVLVTVCYLMLQNAVYGISGITGFLGMLFLLSTVYTLMSKRCVPSIVYIPRWNVLVMKALIAFIYIHAGLAKTSIDWISGNTVREVIHHWMQKPARIVLLSTDIVNENVIVNIFMYGGMLVDIISPLILMLSSNKRLITLFTVSLVAFHILNHFLFTLETFPWVMISSCIVFHPSEVIDIATRSTHVATVKMVRDTSDNAINRILMTISLVCLLIHALLPLSCSIHSIGDTGTINWTTQCKYFRWRMMTRSTQLLSGSIRLSNPITKVSDTIDLLSWFRHMYPRHVDSRQVDEMIESCYDHEDKLLWIVQSISDSAISTDIIDKHEVQQSPLIYADIWIAVNGPPFQRYINNSINLAGYDYQSSVSASIITGIYTHLFVKPTAAVFIFPRLEIFRTVTWANRFQRLSKLAVSDSVGIRIDDGSDIDAVIGSNNIKKTVFLADVASSGWTTLVLKSEAIVSVLHGAVAIDSIPSSAIDMGECVKVVGTFTWKSVYDIETPALLMIVTSSGKDAADVGFHIANSNDKGGIYYRQTSIYHTKCPYDDMLATTTATTAAAATTTTTATATTTTTATVTTTDEL